VAHRQVIVENRKGFTLPEILIVVGILAILAADIISNVISFRISGNLAAANEELQTIQTSASGFR
jgi:prepilin-type N-terminal cleavage/methylation domain-containing protein